MVAHSAPPANDDVYASFVITSQIGPRICSLTVEKAIQEARLKKMMEEFGKASLNLPLEVDYHEAKECMSQSGKRQKVAFVDAKKPARGNAALIKTIDQLNAASYRALLTIIPSGSETLSSYGIRMRELQQDLRGLGDAVIATSCKGDFDCVLVRSESISMP